MAQPVWITPAGSLGTIPEGVFFQLPLLAEDPDQGTIKYEVIAGELPAGIQCEETGLIIGVPKAVVSVQGVPQPVSRDVTSKFSARVYTTRLVNGVEVVDRLADRTFTLTVTGQDVPTWITPPGEIAQLYDRSQITPIQLQYEDNDPTDTTRVLLKSGSLPPGLTVSSTGLISGVIPSIAQDTNYEFILEVTDGKSSSLRTFSFFVYSRATLTADNTFITADNTFITADVTPNSPPVLLSPPVGVLGTVRNDNFYAVQFIGLDFDDEPIEYELTFDPGDSTTLPGLTLDPNTGWLYGYIPNLGITERTYDFAVRVRKKFNPSEVSGNYNYTLNIIGSIDTDVTWLSPSDLGIIDNGATSIFKVEAATRTNIPLLYQLQSGSNSKLPQGLQLLPSGEIAGRVSFDTFSLDNGTTTFDVNLNDLSIGENTETTFDLKYTFTVNAYSVNGVISVFKTFSITVNREYNEPYENLYVEAMPPLNDREIINNLLQNQDIFREEFLYRPSDPNFGRATQVVYQHAYGLTASTITDYVESLYKNHYWKNLTLGSIEVAQATDANGTVIYEVVYSRVIDNLVNDQGQSVSKEVTLPYPITAPDSTEITTVYPNSLINMRDQVIDTVGQVANILPLWMTSKQADGRVLGFTPAWVIAYAKPGRGQQIAYYIRTKFGQPLNQIDFKVDRYELDRLLTKNWDPSYDSTVGSWVPNPPLADTFDIYEDYLYDTPSLNTTGRIIETTNYVGDGTITEFDLDLLPNTGTVIVTLDGVVQNTPDVFVINYGNFPNRVTFATAPDPGVAIAINQIGDISVTDSSGPVATQTIFDGGSLQFNSPSDMYSNTQVYDKYLVFPKRTILG